MRTGTIDLPLHGGSCPSWLFSRMRKLAVIVSEAIIDEYGTAEYLRRLSDPLFFQAFICVSGMDWHSSGGTTTLSAAIKLALEDLDGGMIACGGKGKTSRKTLDEIEKHCEAFSLSDSKIAELKMASRLAAKIDNNCIQDNYSLYHHCFFFDERGNWAVVQQGMNDFNGYARRYHWLTTDNFVDDPPHKIIGIENNNTLNLVSRKSEEARKISTDLVRDNPEKIKKYFTGQATLTQLETGGEKHYAMRRKHELSELDLSRADWKILQAAYEYQPKSYEELVLLKGMGGKKLRALALLSSIIYGTELDWKDPVRYAWAHGGKDGWPTPLNKELYDESIMFLKDVVKNNEKKKMLKELVASTARC